MKPEIKVGQVWKSRDGGSMLKVASVDDTHAHGSSPDGSKPRKVALVRLTANGRNGYDLWEDVDATPEAKAPPMSEAKAEHKHVWIPREGGGFDCKNCPAFGVGAVTPASHDATTSAAPTTPDANMAKEMGMAIAQRITQSAKFNAALITRDCEVNAEPTTPEALHIAKCQKCEVAYPADVQHSCAPSPLEVVRDLLNQYVPAHSLEFGRSALSTLEESIRADELARCIKLADDETANPLIPVGLRLRKRLSDVRGKAVSLERWEESIRADEREKSVADCNAVYTSIPMGRGGIALDCARRIQERGKS